MADVYEKDLAQKTSLTTSDFIRVVGSDNVSYKQGMQSVSDEMIALASKTGSGDANNLTTAGMYWCNGANVTNLPDSTHFFRLRVEKYSSACNQYANNNGSSDIYFRTFANGAWSSWTKFPTRAEVDALKTVTSTTLTSADTEIIPNAWSLRKVGNTVFLGINNIANLPASQSVSTNAIIPSAYRPAVSYSYTIVKRTGASGDFPVSVQINSSGSVYFYNYGTAITSQQPFADTLVWSTL